VLYVFYKPKLNCFVVCYDVVSKLLVPHNLDTYTVDELLSVKQVLTFVLLVSRLKVQLFFPLERNLFVVCDGCKLVKLDDVIVKPVFYVRDHYDSLPHLPVLVGKHYGGQRLAGPSSVLKQEAPCVVVEKKRRHYLVKLTEQLPALKLGAHIASQALIKLFSHYHFWR
jgi:hypothetical protein